MSRVRLLVLAVGWVGLACGACSSPPEKSGYITQGVGLTEGQKKLVPVLECVRPVPQGFAAQFGYENTSGAAQDLVVGAGLRGKNSTRISASLPAVIVTKKPCFSSEARRSNCLSAPPAVDVNRGLVKRQ